MIQLAGLVVFAVSLAGQPSHANAPAPATTEPPAVAPPMYQPGAELYVDASGLAFRRGPSLETERIHYIKRGDKVTVLEDNRVPVSFEAEGIRGHWLYVQHGAYKGYVFDGFLSAEPPPLEERMDWTVVPGVRVGPIASSTTYEELVEIFGQENVAEVMVDLGKGDTEPGTAVFPNSANRLVIQWAKYRKQPQTVQIRGDGSRWKSADGIAVGTPLATLVRLNGKPIDFAGLGRNGGGAVTSWNGGTLEKAYALGTRFGLSLAPTEPYHQDDYLAVSNDGEFTSDLAAVGRLRLRVAAMFVGLVPGARSSPDSTLTVVQDDAPPLAPGTQFYVLASKLNMRAQPVLGSEVVARIPYGARVTAAPDPTPRAPLEAEGMHGHWAAVDYSGMRGYVFDAYLSPIPVPRPDCRGLLDYARYSLDPGSGTQAGTLGQGMREYGQGVRVEQDPSGSEVSLVVPGISLEQAFVLAARCIPAMAGARFESNDTGTLRFESGTLTITIAQVGGGSVRITEGRSAQSVGP